MNIFIIGAVLFAVLGYAAFLIYITWPVSKLTISNAGVFGDSFGVLTSLFSGLAFSGIIITILLQKDELKLQRKELKLTRGELAGQREIMKAQNEQITVQNFEGTFFQMLRLHNELLNSIDITSGGVQGMGVKVFSGRDVFQRRWKGLEKSLIVNGDISKEERLKFINEKFRIFWRNNSHEFSHYFRSLYNIIKFVHNSEIKNKKDYTNIVRAQLSGQEILVLFYNCLFHQDLKFIPLIEEYSLFKHIPTKEVSSRYDFKFYQASAFGENYPSESL